MLELVLPGGQCPHMSGAIEIATKIDPSVYLVHVTAGDRHDISYEKVGGAWKACVFRSEPQRRMP